MNAGREETGNMVNCRNKGRRNEKRAEGELKLYQWLTYLVKGSTIFNKNVDIFGLFDIVAVKAVKWNTSQKQLRKWVQVKSNRKPEALWMHKAKDFKKKYCDENDSVEAWVWVDGKKGGWQKIIVGEDNKKKLLKVKKAEAEVEKNAGMQEMPEEDEPDIF